MTRDWKKKCRKKPFFYTFFVKSEGLFAWSLLNRVAIQKANIFNVCFFICLQLFKRVWKFSPNKKASREMRDAFLLPEQSEGIEPSSKQGINMLSTCVAIVWFSINLGKIARHKVYLASISHPEAKRFRTISSFVMLHRGRGREELPRKQRHLILGIKQP